MTGGRLSCVRGGEPRRPPRQPSLGVKPGGKSSPRPLAARLPPVRGCAGAGTAATGRWRRGRGRRRPAAASPHPPRCGGASWSEDVYPEMENGLLKNKPCANSLIFRFDAYLCLPNFIGEALIGVWVIVPK